MTRTDILVALTSIISIATLPTIVLNAVIIFAVAAKRQLRLETEQLSRSHKSEESQQGSLHRGIHPGCSGIVLFVCNNKRCSHGLYS